MVNNMYYINYFFIFSILGHIIESFVYYNGESGILLIPWTPIYGIGIIIIIIIYNFINKLNINNLLKMFILFLCCSILLSIVEVIGGILIKWIFHTELWNYTDYKFNIGKYTALEMSLLWGMGSIIFIYILKPFFDKIISKIPKYFTYSLIILFITDLIVTIISKH